MLDKLEAINQRFEEVSQLLIQPDVASDMKKFKSLNKEYKDLTKIVDEYKIYRNVVSNIDTNKNILATEKDDELREMAKMDLDDLLEQKEQLEEKIRLRREEVREVRKALLMERVLLFLVIIFAATMARYS